jgi:hypothetical protein
MRDDADKTNRRRLPGKPLGKRVVAYQIEQKMQKLNLSKTALAHKMHTNRSALDRFLDPGNVSVTLQTLERAALALGKRLKVELA